MTKACYIFKVIHAALRVSANIAQIELDNTVHNDQ